MLDAKTSSLVTLPFRPLVPPLPLICTQLPSYLVDHPTLLESYLLWRQELSGSVVRVDSDNGELDTDTAPFESEPTSPSRSRAEIAASSEPNLVSSRRWTSAHASPVRRDPNDAPSSTSSRMRWWMTPRRPDTAPQSTAGGTTVVSAEISKTNSTDMIVVDTHPTPGTGASATTLPSADDVVSGTPAIMTPTNAVATAIMDQDLNTDSSGLQQLSEAPTNSPTTADTDRDFDADGWERRTPHEQALRNPAVHLVGMDVDEDTTNSERPGARAGRRNEDTSPLWRRTRSRVASGPSSTSQGSGSARIVAGEGRNDGEILITQRLRPRVSTRGAVAIASRMEGRRSGIAERINGGGDDGPGRSGSGKTVRTATPRRGAASVASRRPAPGTRMVSPERAGREGSGRRAKRRARAEVSWPGGGVSASIDEVVCGSWWLS